MKRRRHRKRKAIHPIHGRLRELRKAKGLTQEQVADRCEVDKTAVSHWENGKWPETQRLPTLAELFGTTVDELLKTDEIAA